nr:MAG TPA: hypothetical protein [Caudoviricetes sp.]
MQPQKVTQSLQKSNSKFVLEVTQNFRFCFEKIIIILVDV